jgi:hypothetical protein
MPQVENQVEVYIEAGKVRTFAVVPDWPGWCRGGRDEASALQALIDCGPRYTRALQDTPLAFRAPPAPAALLVVERFPGNATTDFGAPDLALPADARPVDPAELERLQTVLAACWKTFDSAVQSAGGKALHKGPRGGGRDLAKIVEHERDVEVAYLGSLGGKIKSAPEAGPLLTLAANREAILTTLALSARGEVPVRGPRGGLRWTPRYFVRRLAWHVLDHAWEIEDRAE